MTDDERFEVLEGLVDGNLHPNPPEGVGRLVNWKLRNVKDAQQPREPLRYFVDELIPEQSLIIVYGAPGCLKSMLLADMCMCVAMGKPWLEAMPDNSQRDRTFRTEQRGVLWVDFDNGTRRTDERIDAFSKGHNVPDDVPFHYVSMPSPWLDLGDLKNVMHLELGALIRHLGVSLVVIDNLGLVTGDVEENSGDMAQVMGRLRNIVEDTGASIIVVHHQRKSNGQAGGRKGETLRGHSSIEAAIDLGLLVERKEGQDNVTVWATKRRNYVPFETFGATFAYDHVPHTYDLHRALFYSWPTEGGADRERNLIESYIRQAITNGENAQQDIVAFVRETWEYEVGEKTPGINKVRGELRRLVEGEVLAETTGDRGQKTYRILFT